MTTVSQIEVPCFSGSGKETVETFIKAVRLAFVPQEALYQNQANKDLASILMLTFKLVGEAAAYYNTWTGEEQNPWDMVTRKLKEQYGCGGNSSQSIQALHDFPSL
jgi:hypothetical protein